MNNDAASIVRLECYKKWSAGMQRPGQSFVPLVLLAIVFAACTEGQTSRYENIAAVRLAGGTHRGWVPDYLPNSGSSIVEFHFVDGDESWLTFLCPASCATALRGLSDPALPDAATRSPPTRKLPWPDAETLRRIESRIRVSGQNRDVIMIDTSDGRAYVWHRLGGGTR